VWLVPVREATIAAIVQAPWHKNFYSFSAEVIVSDIHIWYVWSLSGFLFDLWILHVTMTPNYQQRPHTTGLFAIFDHRKLHNIWNANLGRLQSQFNIITHKATRCTTLEVTFPFRTCSPLSIYLLKYQFAVTFLHCRFLTTILRRINE